LEKIKYMEEIPKIILKNISKTERVDTPSILGTEEAWAESTHPTYTTLNPDDYYIEEMDDQAGIEEDLILDGKIERQSVMCYLRDISDTESYSEKEEVLRSKLEDYLRMMSYEVSVDEAGNLWGTPENAGERTLDKEITLCAHMDKVGRPKKAKMYGDRITGRLDDALGISVIMQVIKNGYRPKVLFTVEEESGLEIYGKMTIRRTARGRYSNGSKTASAKLAQMEEKPKLMTVIEVTGKSFPGDGPVIYTSSGGEYFDMQKIKSVAKIINKKGYGIMYTEGRPNDSMIFASRVPDMGVMAIEMPILNMHSAYEVADYSDVEKTVRIIEDILNNVDKL
jgi:putative aminopeptidase FrvX